MHDDLARLRAALQPGGQVGRDADRGEVGLERGAERAEHDRAGGDAGAQIERPLDADVAAHRADPACARHQRACEPEPACGVVVAAAHREQAVAEVRDRLDAGLGHQRHGELAQPAHRRHHLLRRHRERPRREVDEVGEHDRDPVAHGAAVLGGGATEEAARDALAVEVGRELRRGAVDAVQPQRVVGRLDAPVRALEQRAALDDVVAAAGDEDVELDLVLGDGVDRSPPSRRTAHLRRLDDAAWLERGLNADSAPAASSANARPRRRGWREHHRRRPARNSPRATARWA